MADYNPDQADSDSNGVGDVCDCNCRPGDADGDGVKNLADAIYIIVYIFKGGAAPTPYPKCSGDPNSDCGVNLADAVYIINYIFKGGSAPKTCLEWLDGHPGNPAGCGPPLRK
jgi:hypothetical protein